MSSWYWRTPCSSENAEKMAAMEGTSGLVFLAAGYAD